MCEADIAIGHSLRTNFPGYDRSTIDGINVPAAAEYGNHVALLRPTGVALTAGVDPYDACAPIVAAAMTYGPYGGAADWTGRSPLSWICSQHIPNPQGVHKLRSAQSKPLCCQNVSTRLGSARKRLFRPHPLSPPASPVQELLSPLAWLCVGAERNKTVRPPPALTIDALLQYMWRRDG